MIKASIWSLSFISILITSYVYSGNLFWGVCRRNRSLIWRENTKETCRFVTAWSGRKGNMENNAHEGSPLLKMPFLLCHRWRHISYRKVLFLGSYHSVLVNIWDQINSCPLLNDTGTDNLLFQHKRQKNLALSVAVLFWDHLFGQ